MGTSRYVLLDRPDQPADGPRTAVHVVTDGDPDGVPVLLLNGHGGTWCDWNATVAGLGEGWYAVRYDRPGQGRAGALRRTPTLATEVATLWAVAAAAGVDRAAVLVGHSHGGLIAHAAALTDPDRVRGCVLLESSLPGAVDADPDLLRRRGRRAHAPLRVLATLAAVSNAVRIAGPLLARSATWAGTAGPPEVRARPEVWHRVHQRPEALLGAVAEDACADAAAAELARLRRDRPFPPVPVAVLAATTGRLRWRYPGWVAAQRALAESIDGWLRLVPDAGHLVMLDRPDAVVETLHGVRAGTMTA